MSLKIKFTPPKIPVFRFKAVEMEEMGENVLESNIARAALGLDSADQRSPPLSQRYEQRKSRSGRRPIRDLRFTGRTWAAAAVLDSAPGRAEIGFRSAVAAITANVNQQVSPFFGVSPSDDRKLSAKAQEIADQIAAQFSQGRRRG